MLLYTSFSIYCYTVKTFATPVHQLNFRVVKVRRLCTPRSTRYSSRLLTRYLDTIWKIVWQWWSLGDWNVGVLACRCGLQCTPLGGLEGKRESAFLLNCQSVKAHEDCIHHISTVCEGFSSERQQQSTSYLSVIRMSWLPQPFVSSFFPSSTDKTKKDTSKSFWNFQLMKRLNLPCDPRWIRCKELFGKHEYFVGCAGAWQVEIRLHLLWNMTRGPEQSLEFVSFLRVKGWQMCGPLWMAERGQDGSVCACKRNR